MTTTNIPRPRRSTRSATFAFWVFVGPMVIGLLVFTYIAIGWAFLLSFSRARGTIALGNWVGLDNYLTLLASDQFRRAMVTIVLFTLFIVPVTFVLSLGLALLVNQALRGRAFFRTVFFIPTAVSYVVASLVWKMGLFSGTRFGLANTVLGAFGIDPVFWVGTAEPPTYWLVLVTVRLWLQSGFFMIIFIAALQDIPRHLYEAAYVDGARQGWQTLRYVTLPQLRNASVAVLLLLFIMAFQAFDEFYNIMGGTLSGGGNITLAQPPLVYLYRVALAQQDYGVGSAGAFVLTFLILLVTVTQGRFLGFGRKD